MANHDFDERTDNVSNELYSFACVFLDVRHWSRQLAAHRHFKPTLSSFSCYRLGLVFAAPRLHHSAAVKREIRILLEQISLVETAAA